MIEKMDARGHMQLRLDSGRAVTLKVERQFGLLRDSSG